MINAKRMFILVFTCLFSLSINNVYAQNHDSLTIHSYYLDVNNHLCNRSYWKWENYNTLYDP